MDPVHVYYIWYGNWNTPQDSPAISILEDFARWIGGPPYGTPYFSIGTTYYDSSAKHIANSAVPEPSVTDSYSQGSALSDASVERIVTRALANGALPVDPAAVYFVLTSPDVTETSGFVTEYCGWHSFTNFGATDIKYAFVGNARTQGLGACAIQTQTSPNGNPAADAMASVIAHELMESTSDPLLNAWFDSYGEESADKCAWNFGADFGVGNGAVANVKLGSRYYLIQQDWVNWSGGYCGLNFGRTQIGELSAAQDSLTLLEADNGGRFSQQPLAAAFDPAFVYWASVPGVHFVAADLTGDRLTDFAVFGGPCPGLYVEVSNGDGTYNFGAEDVPHFVAEVRKPGAKFLVADFNGDGIQDLGVLGEDETLTLSLSHSDGSSVETTAPIDPVFGYWASLPGTRLVAFRFTDFANASMAVFGGPCPGLYVEASNGDGTYLLRTTFLPLFVEEARKPGAKFLVADFNGDGRQDLGVLGEDKVLTLSLSNSDGTSVETVAPLDPEFAYWASLPETHLVAGKFNNSRPASLAIFGGLSPRLMVEATNGDGTYTLRGGPVPMWDAEAQKSGARFLIGDFAGDGRQDLAVIGLDGSITVALQNADGTATEAQTSVGIASNSKVIAGYLM